MSHWRSRSLPQMRELYRTGTLDDCRGKWSDFYDCVSLKANSPDDMRVRSGKRSAPRY